MNLRDFDLNRAKQDVPHLAKRVVTLADLIRTMDQKASALEETLCAETGESEAGQGLAQAKRLGEDPEGTRERRTEEYLRQRAEQEMQLAQSKGELEIKTRAAQGFAAQCEQAEHDLSRQGARLDGHEAKGDFSRGSRAMHRDAAEAHGLYDLGRSALEYAAPMQPPVGITDNAYAGLSPNMYGVGAPSLRDAQNRGTPYGDLLTTYLDYYGEAEERMSRSMRLPLFGRGSDSEPKTLFEKIMSGTPKAPPSPDSRPSVNLPSFYDRMHSRVDSGEYQA